MHINQPLSTNELRVLREWLYRFTATMSESSSRANEASEVADSIGEILGEESED